MSAIELKLNGVDCRLHASNPDWYALWLGTQPLSAVMYLRRKDVLALRDALSQIVDGAE